MAIGLLNGCPKLDKYWGVDIHTLSIQWCLRWITKFHPRFQFCCVGFQNDRYCPRGTQLCPDLQLPFRDGLFDVIFLYSVFTHMPGEHIEKYLSEIRRMLKPEGRAMFTVHIGPTEEADDQSGDKLHKVTHTGDFLRNALAAVGLRAAKTWSCTGQELAGQTAIVAERT